MFASQEQGPELDPHSPHFKKMARHGGIPACVFVIPALGKRLADLWDYWPASTANWTSGPGKDTVSKEQREGTGETAQGLRVRIALAERPQTEFPAPTSAHKQL